VNPDRTITDADAKAIACALADELVKRGVLPRSDSPPQLVGATELSRQLGPGAPRPEFFRRNAEEFGGRRVGNGPQPRILFDVATATEAWTARSAARARPPGPWHRGIREEANGSYTAKHGQLWSRGHRTLEAAVEAKAMLTRRREAIRSAATTNGSDRGAQS
jgi:hypothetical protein